jgi:hypothetical protein
LMSVQHHGRATSLPSIATPRGRRWKTGGTAMTDNGGGARVNN